MNGTTRVLIEYVSKATTQGILLESVDPKRDRYGFVYAQERNARWIYDPFKTSSAYRH